MKAYDYLLEKGIKPSVQRMAIMDYLLGHLTHPSIDEIYMALSDKIPTLSKTTVYNTLKLFVEHGAAQMLTIDERNVNFDSVVTPHAHFLCKRCGKIYDFHMQDEQLFLNTFTGTGFQVEEVHPYYRGICAHCVKKEKKN